MRTQMLIGGQWVGAEDGATFPVTDPATDAVLAQVPSAGGAETARAVDAATAALSEWRQAPAGHRATILRRFADLLTAHTEALAQTITAEQGKPLSEARGEVAYALSFIEWAAGEAPRVYGETIPASHPDKRILVLRQAVGVTAAITPWNFPLAMITRKLGPALAAGCTMVIKPAEQTPLTALAMAELAVEAGLPPGSVNVVTGPPAPIASALLADARVRKLSFTGSTAVGRLLMRQASQHLTRLSLELGGHAPFIVFDDADIPRAVAGAMAAKFRNAGQTCISPNRFLVQRGVLPEFRQALGKAMQALVAGRGDVPGVDLGPMIDDAALAKVESHIADATARGARLLRGGCRVAVADSADRFFAPTLLEGVLPEMRICQEETFGPVVPLMAFGDEGEAIELANATPYGLAAYFYTRDASRLLRVAEALEYGIVGANDGAVSTAQAPFGGVKHSGFGREGGHHVMAEYLETKYVSWGLQ